MLQKYNKNRDRRIAALAAEAGRFDAFTLRTDHLLTDFTRTALDAEGLALLDRWAGAARLAETRDAMFGGACVNRTESRAATHPALRSSRDDGERWLDVAACWHAGRLGEARNTPVADVVHVGLGGSLLGPRLLTEALPATGSESPRVHFLGAIDAHLREQLLRELDPARTVVVLVSKSFGTEDTLHHGRRLRDWLRKDLDDDAARARLHAVTAAPDRAAGWGIDKERIFAFPASVGGRFSVWSPVSLAAVARIGVEAFESVLQGAAGMDAHFCSAAPARNLPMRSALVDAWHDQVVGLRARAVVCYDRRLAALPGWLQQLEMESGGKSVDADGAPLERPASPLVIGAQGPDAQHSIFQWLHQGLETVPVEFVGVIRPSHDDRAAQSALLAQMLAQADALATGVTHREGEELPPHRQLAGDRPSMLTLLDEISAERLGELLAFYEHRTCCAAWLRGTNPFDQWGVEYGKAVAARMRPALDGEQPVDNPRVADLVDYIRARR